MIFFCSILSRYICTVIPPVSVSNMYPIPIWLHFRRIGASKVPSPKSLEVHSCTKHSYLWISFLACLFFFFFFFGVLFCLRLEHIKWLPMQRSRRQSSIWSLPMQDLEDEEFLEDEDCLCKTLKTKMWKMKFVSCRSWRWRLQRKSWRRRQSWRQKGSWSRDCPCKDVHWHLCNGATVDAKI